MITGYYDQSPLDEYGMTISKTTHLNKISSIVRTLHQLKTVYHIFTAGLTREPKWGHLKELHAAVKLCSTPLITGTKSNFSLGQSLEVSFNTFLTPFHAK